MHKIYWLENLKGREHLENLSVYEDYNGIDLRELVWEIAE
jgi:hypothetical protein